MKRVSLVLVNGWAASDWMLERLGELLKPHYAIQIVSPHVLVPGQENGAGYAEGLAAIIAGLEGSIVLGGWSLGGIIALETACRFPGRIERLVLMNAAASFCVNVRCPFGVAPARVQAMTRQLRRGPEALLAHFIEGVLAPGAATPEIVQRWSQGGLGFGLDALAAGLDYLQKRDFTAELTALNLPALVVHGKADRIIPWQAGHWLSTRLPQAGWHCYDQVGHALPFQRAEAVAARIKMFVS